MRRAGRGALLAVVLTLAAGHCPGQELRVVTAALPDAVVAQPYRTRLEAGGGRSPYTWGVKDSSLPDGLTLNRTTGEIAGKPALAGMYGFTLAMADSSAPAKTAEQFFRLRVAVPLAIVTVALPPGVNGLPYRAQLRARGGTPPLKWEVAGGALPRGLALDRATGVLSGTLAAEDELRLAVRVSDAGNPPQTQVRPYGTIVTRPLSVEWVRSPQVESGGIYGSVRAWNTTSSDFNLTLIVVAVNEYGKAFTLGYQNFLLAREMMTVEIPFGFSLPRGNYTAHVDAVGEVPPSSIYRARRQQGPLRVE